jgi:hypothetical protein
MRTFKRVVALALFVGANTFAVASPAMAGWEIDRLVYKLTADGQVYLSEVQCSGCWLWGCDC